MRFAIISDIHGHYPALKAAVDDALLLGADNFIFAGDYCISHPYPDECVALVRTLGGVAVRGNQEKYIENLVGADQSLWTDGQTQITYWCYRALSDDNRRWLLSLPDEATLRFGDVTMRVTHASTVFLGDCERGEWRTSRVARRYGRQWLEPGRFQADISAYFRDNADFNRTLNALPEGVYIFGHSHAQWHYISPDGKRALINPGSVGLPMDCVKDGVPYTLLDVGDGVRVDPRRAPFNTEKYLAAFRQTAQYREVPIWSSIIHEEFRRRRESMSFFLEAVREYADMMGDTRRPYTAETWENGYRHWLSKSN